MDLRPLLNRLIAIRKHRAPKGALRLSASTPHGISSSCQKAPSAKRCIKTHSSLELLHRLQARQKAPSDKRCIKTYPPPASEYPQYPRVRKHRAPKGALRLLGVGDDEVALFESESTERQKVHSDRSSCSVSQQSLFRSESTERQKVH